jgi:hypothetical protein
MSGNGEPVTWPAAQLDNVRRLRVLAAGVPNAVLEERDFDVPFARFWDFVADLERSVPSFDRTVTRLEIRERRARDDGVSVDIDAVATSSNLLRTRFDVRLEPGFCWMVNPHRLYVVGMAAVALDDARVHYAHLEGSPLPGTGVSRPLLRRHVRHDIDGIARELGLG